MILGYTNDEIVKLAVENQSTHFDGVVQYNYQNGKLYGCSMSQGESENPLNPVIEVFRLHQGERGSLECNCDNCEITDADEHEECCMNAYIDYNFDEDFEYYFQESVERQIREVLNEYFGETLDKLEEIHLLCSDIAEPWKYTEHRVNNNYKTDILDVYTDSAIEYGFSTTETTPLGYLDSDVQSLINYEYSDNETLQKVASLLKDEKLDDALEILRSE